MTPSAAAARPGGFERIKSLRWSGLENFSRQILSLLFFFVSVRFLQPIDIGIFSLTVALNTALGILIDNPISEALVQKETTSRADWDTGFTVNLAIACLMLVIAIVASPGLAWVLHESRLAYTVPVMSVVAIVGSLGNIHRAHLSRELRFRAIAQTALVAQMIGGVGTVGLAVAGFGYWSQIAGVAITTSITTILYWRATSWRPRLMVDRGTLSSRQAYVKSTALIYLIYFLRDQAPLTIVDLLGGPTAVGFLSLALRIGASLGQFFGDIISRPVLALLSREHHEVSEFGSVLLNILTVIGLVAIPAFGGLVEIGPQLIPIVFGQVWLPAGAMLPWVCVMLGGWVILHAVLVSLRARGLGKLAVVIMAPAVLADIAVLAILAPVNLHWALIGWAIRSALSFPLSLFIMRRYLDVNPGTLIRRWMVPAVATAVMMGIVRYLLVSGVLGTGMFGLGLSIVVGALFYAIMVLIGTPTLLRHTLVMLRIGSR